MANNKNFKIKNSLDVTKLPDFAATTTSTPDGPDGLFSTTLYTGTGSSNTVTTGIDLSGSNEGLVWIKKRGTGSSYNHNLFDTIRGVTKWLVSDDTDAEGTRATGLSAFNSDGFTEGGSGWTGESGKNFVAWTWKSAASFFDVVTYTGTGSARTISHNLGSVPGMIMIKKRSNAGNWMVYHRGANGGTNPEQYYAKLNDTDAWATLASAWNNTAPTSSVFSLGDQINVNQNGETYVAYLFGHDTSSSSNIQCGYYTGNGSASGPSINLGWSPQWLMVRNSERASPWRIIDTARDFSSTATRDGLWANSNANEDTTSPLIIARTSTGFDIKDNNSGFNHSGEKIIYVAIRLTEPKFTLDLSTGNRFSFTPTAATELVFSNPPATGIPTGFSLEVVNPSAYALTWPSSIKWHGGSAPTVNAGKAVYAFITTDGGTNYFGKLAGEGIA